MKKRISIANSSAAVCKNNIIIVFLIAFILQLGSNKSSANAGLTQTPIVAVNHDTIFVGDLDEIFSDIHNKIRSGNLGNFEQDNLIKKLVNDRLIIQEARLMGLDQEDWLLEELHKSRVDNAIRLYVQENYKPDLNVSDDEVSEFFNDYYQRIRIRSLSIKDMETGNAIREQINSGASMDSIAQEISLDTHRYKGGLHNLKYGIDIEGILFAASKRLKPGELSSPFPYRKVYTIIRIEEYLPPDPAELEDLKNSITSIISRKKKKEDWYAFKQGLIDKYPVTIDSLGLRRIISDSSKMFTPDFIVGTDEPIFADEDKRILTETDLRKKIAHSAMTAGDEKFARLFENGYNSAIEEFILGGTALKMGYYDDSLVVERYESSLDSALIDLYLKETVVANIKFKRKEFQDYYGDNIESFREMPEYQLERILAKDEKDANAIVFRLKDGADFNFITKQYDIELKHDDESAEWQNLFNLPESVRNEINELKIGDCSKAFEADQGWMIFKVKDKRPGRIKGIDEVEMQIREVMFQRKFNEMLDKTLEIIKENSEIVYFEKAIDSYFNK